MGRKGASDGGRVGVRGTRRARWRDLRLGQRDATAWRAPGELLAGGVPVAEYRRERLARDDSGRPVSGQRVRPLRRDRQCLGMDIGLLLTARRELGEARQPVLWAARRNPRVEAPEASYDICQRGPGAALSRDAQSRAARICARRATACGTDQRPASPRRWTPRRVPHRVFRCVENIAMLHAGGRHCSDACRTRRRLGSPPGHDRDPQGDPPPSSEPVHVLLVQAGGLAWALPMASVEQAFHLKDNEAAQRRRHARRALPRRGACRWLTSPSDSGSEITARAALGGGDVGRR